MQQVEADLWAEFEEEQNKIIDFDISKLELTAEDNSILDIFFKKFLDPAEVFPEGARHSTIEKNFAIYIVKNKLSLDQIKKAYASKGFNINSLTSQIKGVTNKTYKNPHVNIGELVNWCKTNRPDLLQLFLDNKSKKIQICENINSSKALTLTKESDLEYFYVSTDTSFRGKPQPLVSSKIRLSLAHKLVKTDNQGKEYSEFCFIHGSIDGRELKVYGKKTFSSEFFLYKTISDEREYILLSFDKLESIEQEFRGMLLQSSTSTEINKRFSLRGYVNLFFVGTYKPTIRILSSEELISITSDVTIDDFIKYLFYHEGDKRVYKQPELYSKLLAAVLLSGKKEGYPLHLITIGGAGLGKTKKQESLNFKFNESKGIFEASNSRMKGLIPSFKERPASQGYILECNRIALIDELFKMIEASFTDSHASSNAIGNILQQFNPLLEHKKRTIASGNDNSLLIQPSSKIITDCNPLSNKYTLPEHLNVLDISTLSRFLIWCVDSEHYSFVEREKGYIYRSECSGESPNLMDSNDFLSIYDTLNSFTSIIDENRVHDVFKGVCSQLFDERLQPLWKARGIHHTFLVIDGLCKLRAVFEDKSYNFEAKEEDYDLAQKILIDMIQNMQSPIARGTR